MQTALPNLHPLLVHFPLVLLPAAVLADLMGSFWRSPALERALAALWAAAALSALVAFLAGRSAADGLASVPPAVQPAIAAHADAAWWLLVAAGVLACARAATAALLPPDAPRGTPPRLVLALVGAGLLPWLAVTADRGGALVYRHGLAVAGLPCPEPVPTVASTPPTPSTEDAPATSTRLTTTPDGRTIWAPQPGDLAGPSSRIVSDGEGEIEEAARQGLLVRVQGRRLLLLPEIMGDVQVDVALELTSFEGEVGVLHHVGEEAGDYGAFVVSTAGSARLLDQRPSGEEVLDTAQLKVPQRMVASVNAAGSHLKGLVDGRTVTHGHRGQRPDGRVGLRLDGSGFVRIEQIAVTPLGNP